MITLRMPFKKESGFTIVELLIVIVVLAILAAITIVAYNGIQDRAKAAQAMSGAEQYIRALQVYAADKGAYPTTINIACFDGTVACNGAANAAASTALLNGLKLYASGIPIAMPYTTTLFTNASTTDAGGGTYTGYYILFSIPVSQACPAGVSGMTYLNTSVSGSVRSCRYAMPTP
jgi:prepilin-type N-terminal cleavage/methylation domain-containing protein